MEHLNISVILSGTYWDKKPAFKILVDETEYVSASITTDADQPQVFNVSTKINAGQHVLCIELLNKEQSDTVVDNKGNIVKDMLLNIVEITVNDVPLGILLHTKSTYKFKPIEFDGQVHTELQNCVNLGLNGRWEFEFTSPFYMWLLETL